jgi:hypothetical protein
VTYTVFSTSTCTGLPVFTSASIPLGTVSGAFAPGSVGTFQWIATYNGDANNNAVSTACGAEPLTVIRASPTIATVLSATTITVGGSVTDSATLTGGFSAGGSVTYNLFSGGTCTGIPTVVSTVTVTAGVVPSSAAQTFASTGSFSWNAVYSGDANNNGATSACEPLTVIRASPTIASTVTPSTVVIGVLLLTWHL